MLAINSRLIRDTYLAPLLTCAHRLCKTEFLSVPSCYKSLWSDCVPEDMGYSDLNE